MLLFERPDENPQLREAIEFYKHAHGWTNRLIAGDSLLVMNSLLEKEGMAGKGDKTCADSSGADETVNPDQDRQVGAVAAPGGGEDSVSGRWQRSSAGKRVIHHGKGRGLSPSRPSGKNRSQDVNFSRVPVDK